MSVLPNIHSIEQLLNLDKLNIIEAFDNSNINGASAVSAMVSFVDGKPNKKGYKFDVAIVDPPRKGCSEDVIDAIAVSGAEKIVYVSCNSATLARDIALLKEKAHY